MWTKYCSKIYVPYTLDDILDEGSKFQNRMFISFPQFIYCCDEVYFPKSSCLIAAHDGTLHSKLAPYNGCYASHSWRHKATCDIPVACHVVCALGGTARWLQLQPSSSWPRPKVSAFQYFRWCALTKLTVSHFLHQIYSLSKEEAL